jgi:hypothetical protein
MVKQPLSHIKTCVFFFLRLGKTREKPQVLFERTRFHLVLSQRTFGFTLVFPLLRKKTLHFPAGGNNVGG